MSVERKEDKKQEIPLSNRMLRVANMVTKGNVACDVGCDHGFVSIYLVKTGISPKAIAMDVRKGPLASARANIEEYELTQYIETRLSDGVTSLLSEEADTLICAGMGGKLMKRILEDGKEKVRRMKELILQPQSELQGLREYLRQQEYLIVKEDMLKEDGKYYPIIKAVPSEKKEFEKEISKMPLKIQDRYGPLLLEERNPVLKEFLLKERQVYEDILIHLEKVPNDSSALNTRQKCRREEIIGKIDMITAALSGFSEE